MQDALKYLFFVLLAQVTSLDEEKRRLLQRVTQTQSNCAQMAAQLKEVRDRWQATCLTNVTLYRELMSLRGDLELWQVWLPDTLCPKYFCMLTTSVDVHEHCSKQSLGRDLSCSGMSGLC